MVGKIYFYKILFFIVLFVASMQIHSMEETLGDEQFIKDFPVIFQNKLPFYIIAVTRETSDDQDYPKLKTEEQDLFFSALCFILGQEGAKNNLANFLEKQLNQDEKFLFYFQEYYDKRYEETNGHNIKFLENIDPKFLSQYISQKKQEAKKNNKFYFWNTDIGEDCLKSAMNNSETNEEVKKKIEFYILQCEEKISILLREAKQTSYLNKDKLKPVFVQQLLKSLSNEDISKFFIGNAEATLKMFEQKGELEKGTLSKFFDLQAKYQKNKQFFDMRKKEKNKILDLIEEKITKTVGNSYSLVVLNEMFFGKGWNQDKRTGNPSNYSPLLPDEFDTISSKIAKISKEIPKAIFHTNFLYFGKPITGGKYKSLVQKLQDRWILKESFFDGGSIDFQKLLSAIVEEKLYDTFKNESLIYSHGVIVGSYQKVSYKEEANALLQSILDKGDGALYLFGEGKDLQANDTNLARIINDYISTEICYDLEIGVRNQLDLYPPEGKLHVIVSNTLPLSLDSDEQRSRKRFNNLPSHIPLILHVDPHERDFFINPPKFSFFLNEDRIQETANDIYGINKQKNLIPHNPLFLNSFRLGIGDNVFTFKIWNINTALEKLND